MNWLLTVAHPKLLYDNATLSWRFVVPSLLQMVLSFVLLGICASDYLCPNVARLADSNGRGTGTLMAVLLSWCNSSPDLFSNFMSWVTPNNHGTSGASAVALSIGEVLGACGIILCVVIGAIFVIMASVTLELTYAQRANFVRDLGFAIVAVGLLCYVCARNKVTVANCTIMVIVYTVYLVAKFKFKALEDVLPPDDMELGTSQSPQRTISDDEALESHIKPSLISAMDFNNLLTMLENSKSDEEPEMANLATSHENEAITLQARPFTEPMQVFKGLPMEDMPAVPGSSPVAFAPYHDGPGWAATEEEFLPKKPMLNSRSKYRKLGRGLFQMLLPHLVEFRKKTVLDGVLSLMTAPFVVMLHLSCPQPFGILELDDLKGKYILGTPDVALLFVQSVICPLVFVITLWCIGGREPSMVYWIGSLAVSAGLTALTLQFYCALLSHNRFSLLRPFEGEEESAIEGRRVTERLGNMVTIIFASLGIINAILWISLIANSVIEMMELYQRLTNISQSILGLTIFAWGNSISDLISNIAMCKLYRKLPQGDSVEINKVATKFFMISCASCIGGVMLNSMGGIGIAGLVAMIFVLDTNNKWSVELHGNGVFDYKFIVSCIALVLQIALLAVIFAMPSSLHEWFKPRMKTFGIFMCCMWGAATLCNVLLELL